MSDRNSSKEDLLAKPAGTRLRQRELEDRLSRRQPAEVTYSHAAAILESLNDVIIGLTDEGLIVYWSRGAARTYGYSAEEVAGRHVSMLAPPGKRNEIPGILERLRSGTPVPQVESMGRRKNGSDISGSLMIFPTGDGLGGVTEPASVRWIVRSNHQDNSESALASGTNFSAPKHGEDTQRNLKKAFETMTDGIVVLDRTGRVSYANPAADRMFQCPLSGRCQGEMESLCVDMKGEACPPGRLPLSLAIDEGRRTEACEYGIRSPDGEIRWLSVSCAPFFDEDGSVSGAIGCFRDLTAQRLAERASRETEEKFRLLFERSPDPTSLLDGDIYIDCNQAALRLTRRSRKEEIIGQRASACAPVRQPDGRLSTEKSREEYEKLVREGANRFQWLARTADGKEIWVEVSQTIIPVNGRQITYSVSRDIGERIKAEKRLRESEERYRVAIEHSNDGVAIVRDSRHLYVNRQFCELFGFAGPEEILGKEQSILVHPDDQRMVSQYGSNRQAGKPAPSRYDFRAVRQDGTTILCEASAAKINYLGKPACLSYFRDITERRRSEEALRESEERYRRVVELSPSGILICVEGMIQFANRSLARMLGADAPETLSGMDVFRFIHPDSLDNAREAMRNTEVEGAHSPLIEQKWVRLDGSVMDTAITCFPFRHTGRDAVMAVMEDISQRKYVEESLRRREIELETKSLSFEEANTALKVLLKHRDDDRKTLENAIHANVRELVLPYVDKLRSGHLSSSQTAYLGLVESGLNEIISPFLQKVSSIYSRFTPTQLQVVNMVKGGKTTKEIAELLHIGKATVDSHRNAIRKKLGLANEKANLRTYLLSL